MSKEIRGTNLLHEASKHQGLKVIRYLIEVKKMNPKALDFWGCNTLLLSCGSNTRLEVIKYLIQHRKMNPYFRDFSG